LEISPLSNASSSASPAEFAEIEGDEKQRMYEKVFHKKACLEERVAVLEVRLDDLGPALINIEGEKEDLRRDNVALDERVATLEKVNEALNEEVGALTQEVQDLKTTVELLVAANLTILRQQNSNTNTG
jgi:uncharacterized protein YaaN involved in tellurite resistance